jgi:hypothetical protein
MYTLVLAVDEYDELNRNPIEKADLYLTRAYCFREIEMFINATEDIQSACDLRPYAEASISSEKLYNAMKKLLQEEGIDFD